MRSRWRRRNRSSWSSVVCSLPCWGSWDRASLIAAAAAHAPDAGIWHAIASLVYLLQAACVFAYVWILPVSQPGSALNRGASSHAPRARSSRLLSRRRPPGKVKRAKPRQSSIKKIGWAEATITARAGCRDRQNPDVCEHAGRLEQVHQAGYCMPYPGIRCVRCRSQAMRRGTIPNSPARQRTDHRGPGRTVSTPPAAAHGDAPESISKQPTPVPPASSDRTCDWQRPLPASGPAAPRKPWGRRLSPPRQAAKP